MVIAAAAVHTTGVNWLSIAAIITPVIVALIAGVRWIVVSIKGEMREQVKGLSDVLVERLETKENVNALKIEVARMGEQLRLILVQTVSNGEHNDVG